MVGVNRVEDGSSYMRLLCDGIMGPIFYPILNLKGLVWVATEHAALRMLEVDVDAKVVI